MTLLIVVLALVALLLAALWAFQERLIFFPQPLVSTTHLPRHAEAIEIVTSDGLHVRGWVRPGTRVPAPLVLYFGGNAEEVSWTIADARWPPEWSVAAFNYRGYGRSEGKPGEAALVADALAVYDALAKRAGVLSKRIVVFGRSIGTGVAVKLAALRPVAGAVLVSPYDSLVAVGRGHYGWLPIGLLLKHRFEVLEEARRVRAPLLAVVADRDSIVPNERSRALYDAWAGPKQWRVIAGSDHNTVAMHDAFWTEVGAFLRGIE